MGLKKMVLIGASILNYVNRKLLHYLKILITKWYLVIAWSQDLNMIIINLEGGKITSLNSAVKLRLERLLLMPLFFKVMTSRNFKVLVMRQKYKMIIQLLLVEQRDQLICPNNH